MVMIKFVHNKQYFSRYQDFLCGVKILCNYKFNHGYDIFIMTERRFDSELSSWSWWIDHIRDEFYSHMIILYALQIEIYL